MDSLITKLDALDKKIQKIVQTVEAIQEALQEENFSETESEDDAFEQKKGYSNYTKKDYGK